MARRTTPGNRVAGSAAGDAGHGCVAGDAAHGYVACGFTLVELLVVLVILAILAGVVQPRVLSAVTAAREATLAQDLAVMRDALDQYHADRGRYPDSLAELVERRYLRRIPKDPTTGRTDTWRLVLDLDAEGNSRGIYDVKSGSDGVAPDGTPYAEW